MHGWTKKNSSKTVIAFIIHRNYPVIGNLMPDSPRQLRVFLCHASPDKSVVRVLSQRLASEDWIDVWIDENKLLPGQDWRINILDAVETSDIVVICLSNNSVNKEGYVQKELRYAQEIALEKPEDTLFLIPLRLEDCIVPRGLRFYQWVDYFDDKKEQAYQNLLLSLKLKYKQIEERYESAEKARLEAEEKERQRIEKEKAEREAAEKARLQAEEEERQRIAAEKADREAAEKEAAEQARLKAEKEERQRIAKEKADREAAERESREKARLQAEEEERQRIAKQKVDREAAEKEAAEQERLKAEKEERQRIATEKADREAAQREAREKARLKAEEEERQRIAKDKADREAAEKAARENAVAYKAKLKAEKDERTRLAREKVKKEIIEVLLKIGNVFSHLFENTTKLNKRNIRLSRKTVFWIIGLIGTALIAVLSITNFPDNSSATMSTPTRLYADFPATQTAFVTKFPSTPTVTATPSFTPTIYIDPMGISMAFIPAGEFTMGSNNSYFENERPVHQVYLDSFYMDIYEVSNVLYKSCVDANVCTAPPDESSFDITSNYGEARFDEYPVSIDWNNAEIYCEWRGGYLPTEAQWEKSARSTDSRKYPWGLVFDGTRLNFCDKNCSMNWADNSYDDGYRYFAPVSSYLSGISPYGIYNLAGNAGEWVADWYSDTYYQESSYSNPPGPISGQERVVRGGNLYNTYLYVSSTSRLSETPVVTFGYGFRCAKDVTP